MTTRRRLASLAYSRRLEVLDRLNENVDFVAMIPPLLRTAEEVADPVALYSHVSTTTLQDTAIDYLEFGVFEGWSMSQWTALNRHPDSRFVGFDTFTGLPEDWNLWRKAGAFDVSGRWPDTLVDFLRTFEVKNKLIVHIDCDLYSSTLFCLATLDRQMPSGTVVIFDEFYDLLHEFAAYRDYSAAFMRSWRGIAYTPGYIQVALSLDG
jgi:methyltransferase family protein